MKFKVTFFVFLTFIIAFNIGESAEKDFLVGGKPVPEIIAVVNGEDIESSFLVNQVKIWRITRVRQGLTVSEKEEKNYALELLNKAIDQELLYQEGKKKNIQVGKETIQKEIENIQSKFPDTKTFLAALAFQDLTLDRLSKKIEKQLVEESLIRTDIAPKVEVSEDQVKKVYEANKESYVTPKKFNVSHIFINSIKAPLDQIEDENDRKKAERMSSILDLQARELIDGILKKLEQGAEFAKLAKENSEDEDTKGKGGELGDIDLNQTLPELAHTIAALEPGGISKVVKTSFGYHILKLNKIVPPRKILFKEVKSDILNALLKIEVKKKRKKLISVLRKSAKIKTLL